MISIIMPAYNAEMYIATAIESLNNQTLKNFELVIVNDGSTDRTEGIVLDYAHKEKGFEIRLINQDNKGQFIARRRGIAEARGDFVIFLDADDSLRPDAIEILTDTINTYAVDCVLYNAYKVRGDSVMPFWGPLSDDRKIFDDESKLFLYIKIMEGNTLNNLWLKCFRKEFADDIPGINRQVNVEEDLAQFLPVIDKAKKIIYIDEYLYYYRENSTSVTAKFNINHFYATTEVSKVLEYYAKKWKVNSLYELQTRRYINNIYGSVMQLLKTSCPLTHHQKKEFLLKCANDKYFQRKFSEYASTNKLNPKIILFGLLKARQIRLTLLFGKLIQVVRGKE